MQSDTTLVNAGLFLEFTESTIIWVYIKNGAVVSGLKVGVIIVYGILGRPHGMVWLQLQPPASPKTELHCGCRRSLGGRGGRGGGGGGTVFVGNERFA